MYQDTYPDAIATIRGGDAAPDLRGSVLFYQEDACVLVVAEIFCLPANSKTGFFALHIHEGSSCSGADFAATGSHFNPAVVPHPRHAGDLPPLLRCQENAYLAVRTDRFHVQDILEKTVVIHSDPDDFRSQPAGNAGTKIACGVIHRNWTFSDK